MPLEGEAEEHPRLLLPGFVPESLCKELEFIHRSSCAVGYRPGVLSTTLSHLIATGCAHLIVPFVAIRERLREKVEERFRCEFQLFVEFTGLASWCKGASIGWHSDDNRPYLKQREFSAVCYLNSCGNDFQGGIFHFKDGLPASIVPHAGDALIYTADSRNIHCVDEVMEGERLTLTLWFTRDEVHDEDAKLISLLSKRLLPTREANPNLTLSSPAPDAMYWFPHEGSGFDVRWARLHVLGWTIHPMSAKDHSDDPVEQLTGPLRLGKGEETFDVDFYGVLHALQIVQFYNWKTSIVEGGDQVERESSTSHLGLGDPRTAESVFGLASVDDRWQKGFDVSRLRLAMSAWEDYVRGLDEVLGRSFPLWQTHQVIFSISDAAHSD